MPHQMPAIPQGRGQVGAPRVPLAEVHGKKREATSIVNQSARPDTCRVMCGTVNTDVNANKAS